MNTDERKQIDRRLARIEGQVRGLRRLLEEEAYCIDILGQIGAATAALNQVAAAVASRHVRHCIADEQGHSAHSKAKQMTREELFDELDEVLRRLAKS